MPLLSPLLLQAAAFDRRFGGESCKGGPYTASDFCEYQGKPEDCAWGRYGVVTLYSGGYDIALHAQGGADNCYDHGVVRNGATAHYYADPQSFALDAAYWQSSVSGTPKERSRNDGKWVTQPWASLWGWLALLFALLFVGLVDCGLWAFHRRVQGPRDSEMVARDNKFEAPAE